ncbi:hypothetical protein ACW0JT_21515 [Arthrobacter sp. SA17]
MPLAAGAVAGAIVTSVVRILVGPGVAGPWLQLTAASVAAGAFVIALRTFKFNQLKSKSDLFNTMHSKLLDADIQLGRAVLSDLKRLSDVYELTIENFRSANRALAHYDTLAMYALKGDVVKQDVIETWGVAMHKRADKIQLFIEARAEHDGYTSWPHLRQLLAELEKNPPAESPLVLSDS